MPDLDWNKATWGGDYDWPDAGEEWSAAWASSEAQWFGTLYPRLHRLLPARRILEIAPGFGRWTKFLLPACSGYLGIDLSKACVDACRARFIDAPHALFLQNDGLSLDDAPDGSFDFIFSFDSLVHAEIDVFEAYVPQLLRKLSPDGVAFVHHSNLQDYDIPEDVPSQGRAASVSGRAITELVERSGGKVIVREIIDWVFTGLMDCLTTFSRADRAGDAEPIYLVNEHFIEEARRIAEFQNPYCRIR